jgi:hypothetical protein
MKTYVLMISERFPKTHPKAGQPTEFPASIKHYDKIHTIRKNYAFWEKRIREIQEGKAVLSVRAWVGKPYGKGSTQVEYFRFDKTHGVGIERLYQSMDLFWFDHSMTDQVPNVLHAKNDGLSFEDFSDWFPPVQLKGLAIIHFTSFRYRP